VSIPWIYGFGQVYRIFKKHNLNNRIVFIGSGKLGLPARAAMAFAMGVDVINVAREAMFSIGCIQAQLCHTNNCPTGVATQRKWLERGIDIEQKSIRTNMYFKNFRKELIEITHACGYEHPSQFTMDDVQLSVGDKNLIKPLSEIFSYIKTPVDFTCVRDLASCSYLGGDYKVKEQKIEMKEIKDQNLVRY